MDIIAADEYYRLIILLELGAVTYDANQKIIGK